MKIGILLFICIAFVVSAIICYCLNKIYLIKMRKIQHNIFVKIKDVLLDAKSCLPEIDIIYTKEDKPRKNEILSLTLGGYPISINFYADEPHVFYVTVNLGTYKEDEVLKKMNDVNGEMLKWGKKIYLTMRKGNLYIIQEEAIKNDIKAEYDFFKYGFIDYLCYIIYSIMIEYGENQSYIHTKYTEPLSYFNGSYLAYAYALDTGGRKVEDDFEIETFDEGSFLIIETKNKKK